ncbi:PHP domain-containing protein [Actinoallomurus purpureus]|uniref:PHP domain-containing protein n=1 Tax=Actinoallomurus purpureus TaxID=478114 RepID=UPI002092BB6F|nr:PHP domain-containing protein [Actinoallomurus purpureus]MCO6009512.1 PHP domain-containing protein [Actinoallomurus purpureus]
MVRIDLHSHSSVSDGTQPPADVVRRAHAAGVDVLALTDHDTVAGHAEAVRALPAGMTLVRGMELSCRLGGRSLHLLAYLFDPDEPELAAERRRIREDRAHRARGMVERLRRLGAPVTWETVQRITGDSVPGRPHIARAMVDAGVISSVDQAFTREWIGEGGRAYVDRYALDAVGAVGLVREAGGVPVLAHPRASRRGYLVTDEEIARLARVGLAGIEADHPDHAAADRADVRGLAADLGLFVTGASDDHGELTGHRLGAETTAPEAYETLMSQATGAAPDRARAR